MLLRFQFLRKEFNLSLINRITIKIMNKIKVKIRTILIIYQILINNNSKNKMILLINQFLKKEFSTSLINRVIIKIMIKMRK